MLGLTFSSLTILNRNSLFFQRTPVDTEVLKAIEVVGEMIRYVLFTLHAAPCFPQASSTLTVLHVYNPTADNAAFVFLISSLLFSSFWLFRIYEQP